MPESLKGEAVTALPVLPASPQLARVPPTLSPSSPLTELCLNRSNLRVICFLSDFDTVSSRHAGRSGCGDHIETPVAETRASGPRTLWAFVMDANNEQNTSTCETNTVGEEHIPSGFQKTTFLVRVRCDILI